MSEAGNHLEGQVVDGKYPLIRCIGESSHSVVFLTERAGDPQKAAIKLIPSTPSEAEIRISHWEAAAKLAHPHLLRLYEIGSCEIGNESYCYIVMEYAEENLYQILPDRALTPGEARGMLPPVLDALRFLHSKGFVHRQIKPGNIMANGEEVKLTSDGIVMAGWPEKTPREVSLYDPPEATITGTSPAWDTWSLGVTLVEALTQHPPSPEQMADEQKGLPQSLAMPFADIVRNCLRRRPEQRWSLDRIAAALASPSSSETIQPVNPAERPKPTPPETTEQATFGRPGVLVGSSLFALVLLVVFFGKLLHRSPTPGSPSVSSTTPVPQTPPPNPIAEPPAIPQRAPQPEATPPATTVPEPKKPKTAGPIVRQVVPEVPKSASRTIHGTIKVKVRVEVNGGGDVSSTTMISPGSSAYFARLALQAAREWKFAPAQENGDAPPRSWILEFAFRKGGTRAAALTK